MSETPWAPSRIRQGWPPLRYRARPLSSPSHSPRPHLAALDGLRGLALLGVLFFHANGALPGGYLGVDLFFVLSGFLITRLLLAEHERTGTIVLSAFWVRRARRLFPALLSLMPAIALYARFLARPEDLADLRGDALATIAYVENWRAILAHKSYWQLFAAPSPLEHMWSLSIEEQFYVVWPLVVALTLRRGSRGRLLVLTLVGAALSMAAMLLLYRPESPSLVYLGTHTRAAGILAGAALAIVLGGRTQFGRGAVRAADALGFVAILGLGWAWSALEGESTFLYRGGLWLTEAGVLVLILCGAMGRASLVARLLAFAPLRSLGTISYGAYLWHWPLDLVLSAERTHLTGARLHALQLAVTLVVATLSYVVLERPIRARGLPFGRPALLVPAAIALTLVFIVRGTEARPRLAPPPPPLPPPLPEAVIPTRPPFHVMMFGDSTANSLGWGLRGLQQRDLVVDLDGKDGCTLLADTCGGPDWATRVTEGHPDAVLVFVGGAFMHGVTVDGEWRRACHPGWDRRFEETLAGRLQDLKGATDGVRVVTVPYPLGPWEVPSVHREIECINVGVRRAAVRADVPVLDLATKLCPEGVCQRELEGITIRPDGAHYSIDGAREIARWVMGEIEP